MVALKLIVVRDSGHKKVNSARENCSCRKHSMEANIVTIHKSTIYMLCDGFEKTISQTIHHHFYTATELFLSTTNLASARKGSMIGEDEENESIFIIFIFNMFMTPS